jgi:pyrimidine deaminase RibD-like protein
MGTFRESDRPLLLLACEKAEAALRPPQRLGQRPEPAWSALVALDGKVLAAASFSPGDAADAVKKILAELPEGAPAGADLFLTLEPKAGFDRLPPVTENVRRLGVKRVVLGALDPAQRYRGEGHRVMEQMGIEVVLADGEEARRCQHLLDDYAKWLTRGLAVLRAQVELSSDTAGTFDLKFSMAPHALRADAVICRAGGSPTEGDAWRVVLDPEGWELPAGDRNLVYQTSPPAPGSGVRLLSMRDGAPDLGAVLRDLGSLGFLSAELSGDPELFRLALRSGLIDSVTAHFEPGDDSARALSQLGKVRLSDGGTPMELRLNGARLVGGQLEARVELC